MRRSMITLLLMSLPSLAPLWAQASLTVCASGCNYSNLQTAINAAQPGDTLLLRAGETFTGNFTLPNKGSSTAVITLRSDAADSDLPAIEQRIDPSYAPFLPKIRSGNTSSALTAAAGSHHYRLKFLEFQGNSQGVGSIILLGNNSSQTSLGAVPHDLVLDRVYVHGDDFYGQKRCVELDSANTWILASYISDCKGFGQDTQAIGGFNGPGPFRIQNNYLEGAGENVMFGGADPVIAGLVPTGITIKYNHFFKPVAWRSPILATPQGVTATGSDTGGGLAAGTYGYRVQAITANHYQGETIQSNAAAEVAAIVGGAGTGAVAIAWQPVARATSYLVFGRTPGAPDRKWTVTGTSFTDDGTGGAVAGTPDAGTVWLVKNLFELKNAKDVTVYGNVMEYSWKNGQVGYAIKLASVNQNGGCTWCTVQNVTLSYNIIRHAAGGASLVGIDGSHPSQRAKNLTFAHNLFYDINSTWGTDAYWMQILNGLEEATLDHNTVYHPINIQIYLGSPGSPKIGTLVTTNNLMTRGAYGIKGDSVSEGTNALNTYATSWTLRRNAIAGATPSLYPTDNFFPSVATWKDQFESFAEDVYRLKSTSIYKGQGTDGLDLGVDYDGLLAATAGVVAP